MSSIYDKSSLVLIPSGTKTGKVFSQKPVSGDGDFTFTRASAATRVNADGNIEKETMNLMSYSNNFSQWSPKNGTFAQGVSDPFGGNDAWSLTATNADPYLYLNPSVTGLVTLSVWAKGVGSSIGKDFLLISSGSSPNNSAHILTSEWVRYEGYFNCTSPVQFGFEIPNPAVAGDVVHLYGAQLNYGTIATDYIETTTTALYGGITDNTPRLDYTDSSCPALLLEPLRTNLIAQSEYVNAMSLNSVSATANATTSPEGVGNAYEVEPTGTGFKTIGNFISVTANLTYTISFFYKNNDHKNIGFYDNNTSGSEIRINVQDNTFTLGSNVINGDVEDYGNGWYRAYATFAASSGTIANYLIFRNDVNNGSYTATGSSIYVYGFQVEQGSYPTSYIPTYGSSVTRNVDTCSKLDASGVVPTAYPFSMFAEVDVVNTTNPGYAFSFLTANISSNYFTIEYFGNVWHITARPNGPTERVTSTTTVTKGTHKLVGVWESTSMKLYLNGSLIASGTNSQSFNSQVNSMLLGQLRISGDTGSRNSVRQASLYNTALTNAEAITLTTI